MKQIPPLFYDLIPPPLGPIGWVSPPMGLPFSAAHQKEEIGNAIYHALPPRGSWRRAIGGDAGREIERRLLQIERVYLTGDRVLKNGGVNGGHL